MKLKQVDESDTRLKRREALSFAEQNNVFLEGAQCNSKQNSHSYIAVGYHEQNPCCFAKFWAIWKAMNTYLSAHVYGTIVVVAEKANE